jgi:hypothetical protein
MSDYDKGGFHRGVDLNGGTQEVTAHKPEAVLTEAMWADIGRNVGTKIAAAMDDMTRQMQKVAESVHAACQPFRLILTSDPKLRRILRKQNARETKRQAIERRQVARAVRGIEWAPPLLRNGKVPR